MRQKPNQRIRRGRAGLVVIDIQEKLLPPIFEKERLVEKTIRLIKGCNILRVPLIVTEQYPKGLGRTVAEITDHIPTPVRVEKVAFSACGAAGFKSALKSKRVSDVMLCGMETHVCVWQTCSDLLDQGMNVFVVADAVSSRTLENYRFGLDRMREAGATIVSTEMTLFELLGESGTKEFKEILELIKEGG